MRQGYILIAFLDIFLVGKAEEDVRRGKAQTERKPEGREPEAANNFKKKELRREAEREETRMPQGAKIMEETRGGKYQLILTLLVFLSH